MYVCKRFTYIFIYLSEFFKANSGSVERFLVLQGNSLGSNVIKLRKISKLSLLNWKFYFLFNLGNNLFLKLPIKSFWKYFSIWGSEGRLFSNTSNNYSSQKRHWFSFVFFLIYETFLAIISLEIPTFLKDLCSYKISWP